MGYRIQDAGGVQGELVMLRVYVELGEYIYYAGYGRAASGLGP